VQGLRANTEWPACTAAWCPQPPSSCRGEGAAPSTSAATAAAGGRRGAELFLAVGTYQLEPGGGAATATAHPAPEPETEPETEVGAGAGAGVKIDYHSGGRPPLCALDPEKRERVRANIPAPFLPATLRVVGTMGFCLSLSLSLSLSLCVCVCARVCVCLSLVFSDSRLLAADARVLSALMIPGSEQERRRQRRSGTVRLYRVGCGELHPPTGATSKIDYRTGCGGGGAPPTCRTAASGVEDEDEDSAAAAAARAARLAGLTMPVMNSGGGGGGGGGIGGRAAEPRPCQPPPPPPPPPPQQRREWRTMGASGACAVTELRAGALVGATPQPQPFPGARLVSKKALG
jgi:hypothetical protein